jgi:NitT/TauT family transport system permease protein
VNRALRVLAPLVLIGLILGLWEIACRALNVPQYLLPAPSAVGQAAIDNAPLLLASAWNTLSTALLALVISSLIACSVALLVSLNPLLEAAVRPLAVTIQSTPTIAIAPLALIWAGVEHPERAILGLAVVVAFFPIFSGALTGLNAAEPDLERLFDLYGASPLQRLFRLRLPSATPFLLEGHKVAAGLAIVGAVVAEFGAGSGGVQGLAWRILEASNRLQMPKVFAALLVLAVMAASLFGLLQALEREILIRWRGRGR